LYLLQVLSSALPMRQFSSSNYLRSKVNYPGNGPYTGTALQMPLRVKLTHSAQMFCESPLSTDSPFSNVQGGSWDKLFRWPTQPACAALKYRIYHRLQGTEALRYSWWGWQRNLRARLTAQIRDSYFINQGQWRKRFSLHWFVKLICPIR